MSIFESTDYRKIISNVMQKRKYVDKSYTFQSMAAHMRIQKPYLSKVINGRGDFNSDQMFMACDYLGIEGEERDYLLLLLEYDRSSFEERKEILLEEIEKIQESRRDIKGTLKKSISNMTVETFDASDYQEYYLNPIIQLTHIFLTIRRFRKNPELIQEALVINDHQYKDALKKLVALKMIEIEEGEIKVLIRNLHLPRESRVVSAHHQMLRQLVSFRLSRLPVERKKTFSATFSSSEKARKQIEVEFNKFFEKVQEIIKNEKYSDCYQINFELFPWSNPK